MRLVERSNNSQSKRGDKKNYGAVNKFWLKLLVTAHCLNAPKTAEVGGKGIVILLKLTDQVLAVTTADC
jgi:hypothetical protein